MHERAVAFGHLLELEREAALHARLDQLTELQEQKRTLLYELRAHKVEGPELDALVARAQENITLIRHLVVCLRGCLGADAEPTYTAKGEQRLAADRAFRGVL
jgi:hypothetical protein